MAIGDVLQSVEPAESDAHRDWQLLKATALGHDVEMIRGGAPGGRCLRCGAQAAAMAELVCPGPPSPEQEWR